MPSSASTAQQESTAWNPEDTVRISLSSFRDKPAPRVLIADDDPLTCEYLSSLVRAAGFDIVTAATGREALELLQREYCPIVVTDRLMPDMDGLELCRAIRAQSFPGYVYVLLLTARDAQQDILTGLEAGADDYLSKRVTEAELVARLRTARRIVALEQSLREMLEEKRRQATTDALTGSHNRRYFEKHLAREIKRVRRFGGPLSVLLLDIDCFKAINDSYGHSIGDQVLVQFAERVRAGLPRDYDWSARIGGEEFVVVLPQTDLPGAMVVAEKLRQYTVNAPVATAAGGLQVSISIGVAALSAFPEPDRATMEELMALADRGLYRSKQTGRNRVCAVNLGE